MMRDLVEGQGWQIRIGIAVAASILVLILCRVGMGAALSGPWFVAALCGAMAGFFVGLVELAWPDRLPAQLDALQNGIDRWKQVRTRSTKSKGGRFVWGVGRSLAALMAAWYMFGWVYGFADPVVWAATLGFGISCGFFGLEAAFWAATAVGVAVHLATVFGIGVDFSNVSQRVGFQLAWNANRAELSWLWLLGFIAIAPVWIAIAATFSSVKAKIVEEMQQRRVVAADKKRIAERRERLRVREEKAKDDPLARALKDFNDAQERAKKVGAAAGSDRVAGPGAGEEPARNTGEMKLKQDQMLVTISRYAEAVRNFRRTEASGIEPDQASRTGFDRVIMNMPDDMIEHLRSNRSEENAMLVDYYDELCRVEEAAVRGGDGEVVIASTRSWDEDQIDAMGYGGEMPDIDVLDQDEDEFPESTLAQGRAAAIDSSLAMVLSAPHEVAEDGTPVSEDALPLAEQDEHAAGGGDEEDDVSDGGMDREDALDEAVDAGDGAAAHEAIEVVTPGDVFALEEGGSDAEPPSGGASGNSDADVEEQDDDEQADEDDVDGMDDALADQGEGVLADVVSGEDAADDMAPVLSDDGGEDGSVVEAAPVDQPEDVAPIEAPVVADASHVADGAGAVDGALVQHAGAEQGAEGAIEAPVEDSTVAQDGPAGEGAEGPVASPAERRRAAGVILSGMLSRDFVMSTVGWFETAADAGEALGLDDTMFVEPFARYDVLVHAARLEGELGRMIDTGTAAVADVEASVEALEKMDWEADAGVLLRARTWIAEQHRIEEERLRRIEEERVAAEEAARVAREAREQAEREEREREEQAERERQEQAERERQEREERERAAEEARVEAERKAALEAKRSKFAIRILAGKLDDDILRDGIELFPDVEALAEELELEVGIVEGRFDEFRSRANARMWFEEVANAFRDQDVNAVETLLAQSGSFDGHEDGNVNLTEIRKWVDGERARERLAGLRDGEAREGGADVSEVRRMFMKRQLGLDKDVADLIDTDLPQAMKLAASLSASLEMLGEAAPQGVVDALEQVRRKVGALAVRVTAIREGKGSAREYVMAFLPVDLHPAEGTAWDMLVGLADAADGEEHAATPEVSAAPAEEAPVAEPADREGGRVRGLSINFDASRKFGPDDIAAMDVAAVLKRSTPKTGFAVDRELRALSMSMREIYGEKVTQLALVDQNSKLLYAAVRVGDEQIGRVKVSLQEVQGFAWYRQDTDQFVLRDVKGSGDRNWPRERFEKEVRNDIVEPNGDPDGIVGIVVVSPILTEEGAAALALAPESHPRVRIMSLDDAIRGKQLVEFVAGLEREFAK